MLPKDYTAPVLEKKSGGYLNKFEEGETRIRIVSPITTGFKWAVDAQGNNIGNRKMVKGEKTVRVRTQMEAIADESAGTNYKHFWAMVVWNYGAKQLQIMEIHQKKIQSQIQKYEEDEDWGDTQGYDIVISRTGMEFENTDYQVIPKPAKPISDEIAQAVFDSHINLGALFTGENPFSDTKEAPVQVKQEVVHAEEVEGDEPPF